MFGMSQISKFEIDTSGWIVMYRSCTNLTLNHIKPCWGSFPYRPSFAVMSHWGRHHLLYIYIYVLGSKHVKTWCTNVYSIWMYIYNYIYKDIIRTSSMEFNVSSATRIVAMCRMVIHPISWASQKLEMWISGPFFGATMRYDQVPYVWPYFAGIFPNYVPLDPWSQSWTPQSIHECFTDLQQLFQTLERFQAHWELQEPSCMDQLANRLCQWLHKGLWLEPTLRCCGTPQPNFENPMPHIVRQVAKLWAHKGHSKCGWGRPPVLRVSQLMEVQVPIVPLFLEIHLRIFRVVGADDVASRSQIGAEELPPQVVRPYIW